MFTLNCYFDCYIPILIYSNQLIVKILKMEYTKKAKPHTCGLCSPLCCNYIQIMYRNV